MDLGWVEVPAVGHFDASGERGTRNLFDEELKFDISGTTTGNSDISDEAGHSDISGEDAGNLDISGEKVGNSDFFGKKLEDFDIPGKNVGDSDVSGEEIGGGANARVVVTFKVRVPLSPR